MRVRVRVRVRVRLGLGLGLRLVTLSSNTVYLVSCHVAAHLFRTTQIPPPPPRTPPVLELYIRTMRLLSMWFYAATCHCVHAGPPLPPPAWRLDDGGMVNRDVKQVAQQPPAPSLLSTTTARNDPAIVWQVDSPGYPFDQAVQGRGGIVVGAKSCDYTFGQWDINGTYSWQLSDPTGHTGCMDGSYNNVTTYFTTQARHQVPFWGTTAWFHSFGVYPGKAWSAKILRQDASGAEKWSVSFEALSNINLRRPLLLSDDATLLGLLAANCTAGFDNRST